MIDYQSVKSRPFNPELLSDEELLSLYEEIEGYEKAVTKNAITFYQPNVHGQEPFHESGSRIRVLLGGNRSGKTTAGSCEAIAHALGHRPWLPSHHENYWVRLQTGRRIPVPNVGTILGESYKISVDRVLVPTLYEWLPKDLVASAPKNQQGVIDTIELKNGSKIRFMTYNQDPKEFEGFKSHWAWYDEPPKQAIFTANERSLVDYGGQSWFTMTPIRQPWIWEEIVSKEGLDRRIDIFRMSIWDNAKSRGGHLADRFIHEFLDSLPAEERRARELGEFLHLQGRVFPEWLPKPPFWIPYSDPKRSWVRVMGIDPHPRKPIACAWAAISPHTGIWYVYRELYDPSLRLVEDVADKIHELEKGEDVVFRVIDPSSQENERTSDSSVYERFMDEGIFCELAQKSDKDGRQDLLHKLLKIDPVYKTPSLVVYDRCPRLRHEFMNHVWDEWSPASRDSHDDKQEVRKKDDDLLDVLMYLCQYGLDPEDFDPVLAERKFREGGERALLEGVRVTRPRVVGSSTGY